MNTIIDNIGDAISRFTDTWGELTNNSSSANEKLTAMETELSGFATNDFYAFRLALREEKVLARTNVNIEGGIRWAYFNQDLKAVIYNPASELLYWINLWLERNDNPQAELSKKVKVLSLEPMYGPESIHRTTIKIVRLSKNWLEDIKKVIKKELKGSPGILNDPDSLRYVNVKATPDTSTPMATKGPSLRQQILKHFYEGGKMVERKHKHYNDYILYCTREKRLACSNESESKLKHLIKNIEIVIPHLADEFRQDAEGELNTLKRRLSVEN